MKHNKGKLLIVVLLFIGLAITPSITARFDVATNDIVRFNNGYHPPIIIDGNDDFTSENGVTGGSGTENDPYIIENWIIIGDGSTSTGIWINDTYAHFVINNCTIKNFPDTYDSGIYLNYVENGVIENITSFRTQRATVIDHSENIEIINCTSDSFSTEWFASGVSCYDSSYIYISSCDFYSKGSGIKLHDTSNCIIENSSCHNNNFSGIEILGKHSYYNTIKNCKLFNNTINGINLWAFDDERHSGYTKILYCKIYNNGLLPNYTNVESGISIWNVHENIVEDCDIHHNGRGIHIDASRGNIVRNCRIFSHRTEYGISAEGIQITRDHKGLFKGHNKIQNCEIYDNEIGITTFSSLKLKVEYNNLSNNGHIGIFSCVSFLSQINNNNIYGNGGFNASPVSSGVFCWLGIIDVRNNWWGAENGPRYRFHFGDGDEFKRWVGIIMFRPWATEPIPDAGVN